jgi:hypothetical protein
MAYGSGVNQGPARGALDGFLLRILRQLVFLLPVCTILPFPLQRAPLGLQVRLC